MTTHGNIYRAQPRTFFLLPLRVNCAKHIKENFSARSWYNQVAIDPCSSLLPKTEKRSEEQKVAAMGTSKWMSKKSRRKVANLRAPSTAKKQAGGDVTQVHWTPVLARDKIYIYVCDEAEASKDPDLPAKLNNSADLAKFVVNVLPKILAEMQRKYKWTTIPRVVVHDKASYMVTSLHDRLNVTFAGALEKAGFTSWVGDDVHAATKWLVAKWGDVHVHETAISHIRRLLDTVYTAQKLHETSVQLRVRMQKVAELTNSASFAAAGGRGLAGLVKDAHARCDIVIKSKGERAPK